MSHQIESKREGSGTWFNGLAGETLGARKLVYLDTTGAWKLADADDATAFTAVGITGGAISNGKRGKIILKGFIGDADWSWASLGSPIYATSVAGELSQTEPIDGVKIQVVALAFEDDLIYFNTGLNQEAANLYANSNNWDDLRFPVGAIKIGAANPPDEQAYKGGLVLSYPSNQNRIAYITAQIPHTWVEGTELDLHFHWVIPVSGAGGGTENVKWDITYSWANQDAAFPGETSDSVTVDVQNQVADVHTRTDNITVTGTGKTFSSILIISLERDVAVANNYASAAYLLEFDIHYMKNRFGTIEEDPA